MKVAHSSSRSSSGVAWVILSLRAVWGLCLLVRTRRVLVVLGAQTGRKEVFVSRALGLRQLVQVAWQRHEPRRESIGALVDAAHAVSSVAAAAIVPRWRRAALFDACVATALGGSTLIGRAAQVGGKKGSN